MTKQLSYFTRPGAHFPRDSAFFEEYSKKNPNECLRVIVDEEPDLCEEYNIEYYPTVIMFKKGKVHKHLVPNQGSA